MEWLEEGIRMKSDRLDKEKLIEDIARVIRNSDYEFHLLEINTPVIDMRTTDQPGWVRWSTGEITIKVRGSIQGNLPEERPM